MLEGYTAGQRSKPCFGWAKNLLRKHTAQDAERLACESSSVFAVFWNMCRYRLPAVVVEDVEKYLATTGVRRMDAGGVLASGTDPAKGHYTVSAGDGIKFTINDADLAPPTGVMAANYSR